MHQWTHHDWPQRSADSQLKVAQGATPDALCDLVRAYDWDLHPAPVLGWVMGQRGIDLASAVRAFLNGTPERYNRLHKRDVPDWFQPSAWLLDTICLRLNCGLYSVDGDSVPVDLHRLSAWIAGQQADRQRNASGRWVLDEGIIAALWHTPTAQTHLTALTSLPESPRARLNRWLAGGTAEPTRRPVHLGE